MRRPLRSSASCTTLPTWFVVLRVCVHHNTARQSCYCTAHLEGLPLSAHPVLYAAVWHASWWLLECPCSHGAKVQLRCTLRPLPPNWDFGHEHVVCRCVNLGDVQENGGREVLAWLIHVCLCVCSLRGADRHAAGLRRHPYRSLARRVRFGGVSQRHACLREY